jgi:hypothetical protein
VGQNLSVRPIPLWHITSNLWARTCQWGQYLYDISQVTCDSELVRDRPGRDRMVVGFTTTYGISAIRGGVLYAALCDEVCQWLVKSGVKRHNPNSELVSEAYTSLTDHIFFIIYTYYTCIPRGNIKLSPLAMLDKGHNKIPSLSL